MATVVRLVGDKRARSDKRHRAHEHVEQLWQLIQRIRAQESPYSSHPIIARPWLEPDQDTPGLGVHAVKARSRIDTHGSEFPDAELSTVLTYAVLTVEHRAAIAELHSDRDGDQHGAQENEEHEASGAVENGFHQTPASRQLGLADLQKREPLDWVDLDAWPCDVG